MKSMAAMRTTLTLCRFSLCPHFGQKSASSETRFEQVGQGFIFFFIVGGNRLQKQALRMSDEKPASYRPSAYYFRKALRGAKTKAQAVEAGLQAVRELEYLKEWIRGQGMIPPKRYVLRSEAQEKQWKTE